MAEDSIQVFVSPPLADPHNPCAARPLKKHWGGPPGHEAKIADYRSDQSSPPKASLIMFASIFLRKDNLVSRGYVPVALISKTHFEENPVIVDDPFG